MLPQCTCDRQDLWIAPNSCSSDLSDSLNLMKSQNSTKVLLHLGKFQCIRKDGPRKCYCLKQKTETWNNLRNNRWISGAEEHESGGVRTWGEQAPTVRYPQPECYGSALWSARVRDGDAGHWQVTQVHPLPQCVVHFECSVNLKV